MKTEVIMKRELFGHEISQKSQSEFFSATDLVRAGNLWRSVNKLSDFNISAYFNNQKTKEYISEVELKYGCSIIKGRGRSAHTWVHPLVFIDMALSINPKLKVEVYEWLFDKLIKYRNDSGDSYKKMCGVLWAKTTKKTTFHISIANLADTIKVECGVKDWQTATEYQLKLRDRIHENIALLADVMNNLNEAIRIGILKAKQN